MPSRCPPVSTMAAVHPHRRELVTALVGDVAVVVVFVLVGRRNHHADGGVDGFVRVAWPFVVALLVGWAALRVARMPRSWRRALPLAIATAWGGVLLRIVVQGRDLKPSFVVVATLWFVAGLVGWRLLAVRRGLARVVSPRPRAR